MSEDKQLGLPEGSSLQALHIYLLSDGSFDMTMWVRIPGKRLDYRVNIKRPTLKEALLEAGKFLDEGLGLDIGLSVKDPI